MAEIPELRVLATALPRTSCVRMCKALDIPEPQIFLTQKNNLEFKFPFQLSQHLALKLSKNFHCILMINVSSQRSSVASRTESLTCFLQQSLCFFLCPCQSPLLFFSASSFPKQNFHFPKHQNMSSYVDPKVELEVSLERQLGTPFLPITSECLAQPVSVSALVLTPPNLCS